MNVQCNISPISIMAFLGASVGSSNVSNPLLNLGAISVLIAASICFSSNIPLSVLNESGVLPKSALAPSIK